MSDYVCNYCAQKYRHDDGGPCVCGGVVVEDYDPAEER